VKITEVVNQQRHNQVIFGNEVYSGYSKASKLFGIDLLIDDLRGVELECNHQGSESLILNPGDKGWAQKVVKK
jgi:hypothetical protein